MVWFLNSSGRDKSTLQTVLRIDSSLPYSTVKGKRSKLKKGPHFSMVWNRIYKQFIFRRMGKPDYKGENRLYSKIVYERNSIILWFLTDFDSYYVAAFKSQQKIYTQFFHSLFCIHFHWCTVHHGNQCCITSQQNCNMYLDLACPTFGFPELHCVKKNWLGPPYKIYNIVNVYK